MARLTAGLWSCNSVAPSARAAERRRLRELLHEHPAIRLDDALRRDVIRIRGEFDVAQAGLVHFVEELLQGLRRIAPALLPGNDGVPDMPEAVRRERARCPAASGILCCRRTRRPTSSAGIQAAGERWSHPEEGLGRQLPPCRPGSRERRSHPSRCAPAPRAPPRHRRRYPVTSLARALRRSWRGTDVTAIPTSRPLSILRRATEVKVTDAAALTEGPPRRGIPEWKATGFALRIGRRRGGWSTSPRRLT